MSKALLFVDKLDSLISNIPRSDYYYKDKIISDSYLLIEYIMRANYSVDDDIRSNCLTEILVNISVIDKLLDRFYKKKYISEKQLYVSVKLLTEVYRMVKKWLG